MTLGYPALRVAGGIEGGSPHRELTGEETKHKEQGGTRKENAADIPSAPKIGAEQQDWWGRPHKEMVRECRSWVQKRVQAAEGEFAPADIVYAWISLRGHPRNRRESDFYVKLELAWDALAYDYYIPGSPNDFRAGDTLHNLHRYAKIEAIKLTDPLQVRILDVLSEAVGIPHQKGQTEVKIPEKLKDYNQWMDSKEREEIVDKAIAEQQARKTRREPENAALKVNIGDR